MNNRRILLLAPIAAFVAGCATAPTTGPVSVAHTLARQPDLSTLNGLMSQAGLAETLKAAGPYTVFAPTNEAFKAVPARTMDELSRDPAKLKALLAYHVVAAEVTAGQVRNGKAKTVNGASVALSKAGDFVTVEEAIVLQADIKASNGVVHTVDRVLMPPKH